MHHGRIVWGQDFVPIFLCAWDVLKVWCLHSMEKIKDSKVKCVVFAHLNMVMFMSINPNETIDDFKACGREMVVESFDHSYEILSAGMLWKPKEARILTNFIDQPVNIR